MEPSSARLRFPAWMCAALLLSGCHSIHYQTQLHGGGRRIQQTFPFFLGGLAGEATVDLDALCPKGAARWYSQQTFADGLLGWITLGIYTPRTVVVECAGET